MDQAQFQQFMKAFERMAAGASSYGLSARSASDATLNWGKAQKQLEQTIKDVDDKLQDLATREVTLAKQRADAAMASPLKTLTKADKDYFDQAEKSLNIEKTRLGEQQRAHKEQQSMYFEKSTWNQNDIVKARESWELKQRTKNLEESLYDSIFSTKKDLSTMDEGELEHLAKSSIQYAKLDDKAKEFLKTQIQIKAQKEGKIVTEDDINNLLNYQSQALRVAEDNEKSREMLKGTSWGRQYLEQIDRGRTGWEATGKVVRTFFEKDLFAFMNKYLKELIDMQEKFTSSTFEATGSINQHVAAVNQLNSMNKLGAKINQEAYEQIIQTGIQYGSSREELIDLANTHVMASRVMGVSTQEAANLTKVLVASGASTKDVNNTYGKLATIQGIAGISTAKMTEIIKKTTEATNDLLITFGGAPGIVENYASGLAAIQAAYGTQKEFAPFVAQGLTSLMEKMTKATVLSGNLMASFAYMSGASADPVEQFTGAVTEMVKTVGPKQIMDTFGKVEGTLSAAQKAQRDAMQDALAGSLGMTKEEMGSIGAILQENNGSVDLAMNKIKELQQKKADDKALADKANASMETMGKQLEKITNTIKSSIGPVIKPVLDIITKAVEMIAWVFEKVPGLGKAIGITALVLGGLAFAKSIGFVFKKLLGISSILPGITSKLAAAGAAGGGGGGGGLGGGKGLLGKLTGGVMGKMMLGGLVSAGIGAVGGFISSSKKEEAEKLKKEGKTAEAEAALASADRTDSATSGAATGAMIGSFLGPIGMAAGGLIGGVWGYFSKKSEQDEAKKKQEEAAAKAKEASEKQQQEIAKKIAESSSKDRFDRIAQRRGISREEAMLTASKKSGVDRKKASQERREAADAARAARKQKLSDEASKALAGAAGAIGAAGVAGAASAAQISNAAIKETKAQTAAVTASTVSTAAAASAKIASNAKEELTVSSMATKALMYSPIGLAVRGAGALLGAGQSMIAETMGMTKSFFSSIFGADEEKDTEIKKAADRIIEAMRDIHNKEKEENKSIKDILSAISENTEPRTSSAISTVWR